MAIMKVTAWKAEAEVMGRLVEVEFGRHGLTLFGLSETEAHTALETLSTGALVGVAPAPKFPGVAHEKPEAPAAEAKPPKKGAKPLPPPPPNTGASLEAAKIPAAAKPTEADLKVATTQAADAAQMAKATDGLNAATQGGPPPEVTGYATQVEAPKKAEQPSKPEQATSGDKAVAAAQGGGEKPADEKPDNVVPIKGPPEGVVPDLTKAKQLKDVVSILNEHYGIKDVQGMIKKCQELKDSVPVLMRIADIPARVERTMVLLGA
jgi:hypothetical protein